MLCFVLINRVLLNILYVWILLDTALPDLIQTQNTMIC